MDVNECTCVQQSISAGYLKNVLEGETAILQMSRDSLDVQRVEMMLREAGITDFEPRVVGQLLEVAFSTTRRVLLAAKSVSQHCGKTAIDENDVQIALEFTGVVVNHHAEREKTLRLAAEKNAQPLPPIRHNFGLKLPNDRFCLVQPNVEWQGSGETPLPPQPPIQPATQLPRTVHPDNVVNILKRPAQDDYD